MINAGFLELEYLSLELGRVQPLVLPSQLPRDQVADLGARRASWHRSENGHECRSRKTPENTATVRSVADQRPTDSCEELKTCYHSKHYSGENAE